MERVVQHAAMIMLRDGACVQVPSGCTWTLQPETWYASAFSLCARGGLGASETARRQGYAAAKRATGSELQTLVRPMEFWSRCIRAMLCSISDFHTGVGPPLSPDSDGPWCASLLGSGEASG
eukprot:3941723-Rhodomonas_salina.4